MLTSIQDKILHCYIELDFKILNETIMILVKRTQSLKLYRSILILVNLVMAFDPYTVMIFKLDEQSNYSSRRVCVCDLSPPRHFYHFYD